MLLNLRFGFFIIIYCTKEQRGSFTISPSALKKSVVFTTLKPKSVFTIGLDKLWRFVHLLISTDIKKNKFKFIPSWTIHLLLPQWHRLKIKAGLMSGEDTEGSGPMDAHTGED